MIVSGLLSGNAFVWFGFWNDAELKNIYAIFLLLLMIRHCRGKVPYLHEMWNKILDKSYSTPVLSTPILTHHWQLSITSLTLPFLKATTTTFLVSFAPLVPTTNLFSLFKLFTFQKYSFWKLSVGHALHKVRGCLPFSLGAILWKFIYVVSYINALLLFMVVILYCVDITK